MQACNEALIHLACRLASKETNSRNWQQLDKHACSFGAHCDMLVTLVKKVGHLRQDRFWGRSCKTCLGCYVAETRYLYARTHIESPYV